ncbi:hypothetical protein [Brevibacterium senegalense]|uniref:hypothetical protein n=1 Tax=Brevibacterium senegalense TaxID=1033736 RepID=UPI0002F579C3|nr:hypothetical protein [Brevibacterium senegalense]
MLCAEDGCSEDVSRRAQPYCRTHYLKNRAAGPLEHVRPAGAAHPAFKDARIGVDGAHDRIRKERGAAWNYRCARVGCVKLAEHWSLIPGHATHCLISKQRHYSVEPADYLPLCRSCHTRLDKQCDKYLPPVDTPALPLPGFDLEAHRITFDASTRLENGRP